jgi:hypothetical protein
MDARQFVARDIFIGIHRADEKSYQGLVDV